MTGFGEAHSHHDGISVRVEVRTINSRYFKLSVKCSDGYSVLEPEIEGAVRQQVRRGTLQVSFWVDRPSSSDDYKINTAVLAGYRRQLEELHKVWPTPISVPLESLLQLPGVVVESERTAADAEQDWPAIRSTLEAAMHNLAKMRTEEGGAMAADLRSNSQLIGVELREIERRAPLVVDAYRSRMTERLQNTLAEFKVTLDPSDVIKEVSIYADRSDISEEIVRLGSHLVQFDQVMELPESAGRKLEFIAQEMLRETNTIGSKANDVEIARHVIEIKAAIERIKEMIQNVE
jgi:uncharacterized protein (TIGR00255 family)